MFQTAHISETLVDNMELLQIHNNVEEVWDLVILSSKWDDIMKIMPQGSGSYWDEKTERFLEPVKIVDSKEECIPDITGQIKPWTNIDCSNAHNHANLQGRWMF